MKRALYNITDEEFAYFVNEIGKGFDEQTIPYVFVGGTATQMHIIKRLYNIHKQDINTMAEDVRLQDYLRSTDDIDVALSSGVYNGDNIRYIEKINKFQDFLNQEVISPTEEHVVKYESVRKGAKRPVFQIHVDDKTDDEKRIALNISRRPQDLVNLESKFYQFFVDNGKRVEVPYNQNLNINVKVINPIHLLAAKISHFRAKDTMDIHNLVDLMRDNNEQIDFGKIKEILGVNYSANFERFLSLIKPKD